jgi:hypothetical protein
MICSDTIAWFGEEPEELRAATTRARSAIWWAPVRALPRSYLRIFFADFQKM